MSTTAHVSESTGTKRGYLPHDIKVLTPEMIQMAEIELNETPRRREEALQELKLLIEEEKDFRPFMDDQFLLRFLRTRKFNTEKAMTNLRNYYTYKARYSGVLTDVLPSQMNHVINANLQTRLPYRDREGRLVALSKFGHIDPNITPMEDIIATSFLNVDYCLQSEATQICGVVLVVDFKGISLANVRYMAAPRFVYRFFTGIQYCIPARVKAFHIINEPVYFSIVYHIAKRFLSEKIKRRLQCHGKNLENFHKQVPPEILPREFGGYLGPMDNKEFGEEILGAGEDYFIKLSAYGYGEETVQSIKMRRFSFL